MFKKIIPSLLILLTFYNSSSAQYRISHEIGLTSGPSTFKSDYGERNDLETNVGNSGLTVGFLHYINFSSNAVRDTYFSEHFKVRSELSFSSTKFNNFGKWVNQATLSTGKEQLKAMSGSSNLLSLGVQLEYHFKKIHDFENTIGTFDPYLSIGLAYSFYSAEVTSTLGPLGTSITTPPKYLTPSDGRPHGFSTESKGVASLISGIGVRYKLTRMGDLLVDMRSQYFASDWVDGLNPNKEIYKENKAKDWIVWFNLGYIQYLDF